MFCFRPVAPIIGQLCATLRPQDDSIAHSYKAGAEAGRGLARLCPTKLCDPRKRKLIISVYLLRDDTPIFFAAVPSFHGPFMIRSKAGFPLPSCSDGADPAAVRFPFTVDSGTGNLSLSVACCGQMSMAVCELKLVPWWCCTAWCPCKVLSTCLCPVRFGAWALVLYARCDCQMSMARV